MNNFRLSQGMRIRLRGREYVIEKRVSAGDLQLRDALMNSFIVIKETLLIQSIFTGDLELFNPVELGKKDSSSLNIDFTQMSEKMRREAKRRHAYVILVLELSTGRRSREQVEKIALETAAKTGDPNPPSVSTLYRWLRDYEAAGLDIRALVPSHKKKGNRNPKLSKEVQTIIDNVIAEKYLTPQRPSVKDIYETVVARIAQDNQFRLKKRQIGFTGSVHYLPENFSVRRIRENGRALWKKDRGSHLSASFARTASNASSGKGRNGSYKAGSLCRGHGESYAYRKALANKCNRCVLKNHNRFLRWI